MTTSFNEFTTNAAIAQHFADQIKGKRVLITGPPIKSLGFECAKAIAAVGAAVVLAGRSLEKLEAAKSEILKHTPSADISTLQLDLASASSVRTAAAAVQALPFKLDVLINSAAVGSGPYTRAPEMGNHELLFATNHLGHFLFTNLIKSKLANPARVVTVTSGAHRMSPVLFDDVDFEGGKTYTPGLGYAQSKCANVLFTVELAKRWKDAGVKAYTLHPGVINTNLAAKMTPEALADMGLKVGEDDNYVLLPNANPVFKTLKYKTLATGAATYIAAAFDPALEEHSGGFLEDCQLHQAAPHATDPESAERLWKLSEKLLEQEFA